ncbi:MAG: matrixin family metalloprotease, partial [Bdellovibrionales bacterium]|nr:matrixin family metalloprotease [Bdellovibrionales bacterium]
LALFLAGCGKNTLPWEASGSSARMRWEQFPVVLWMDPAIAEDAARMDDVHVAVAWWEEQVSRPLFDLRTWSGPMPPYAGGTATDPQDFLGNVLFFQDPWPHAEDVKGKTFLLASQDRLEQGLIALKGDEPYCHGGCAANPGRRVVFQKLVAHELGHFLGLPHTEDPESLMSPDLTPEPLPAATVTAEELGRIVN